MRVGGIVKKPIPEDILRESVLAHVAAAYFSVGKQLERKTHCSATRGFILHTLRGGVALNQNQIATVLGFDRTVVHRAIKSMASEGLVCEKKVKSGRAILVELTARGHRYRDGLIQARRAADEKIRLALSPRDRSTLLRLLKIVFEIKF